MSDVRVDFKSDSSQVDKNITKIKGGLGTISTSAKGVGVALKSAFAPLIAIGAIVGGFTAVTGGIKSVINLGGDLEDLSQKTGMAVDQLLELQTAFELSGVGADKVGAAVLGLNKKIESPTKQSTEAFEALGLSLSDLKGLSMEDKFKAVSSAISGLDSESKKASISSSLFGKSLGGALLPLFANKNALSEAKTAVGGLGAVMQKNAATFEKLGDALDSLKLKSQQFFAGILGVNAGGLDTLADKLIGADFTQAGVTVGEAIKEFSATIRQAYGGLSFSEGITKAITDSEDNLVSVMVRAFNAGFDSLYERFKSTPLWTAGGRDITVDRVGMAAKSAGRAVSMSAGTFEPFWDAFSNQVNKTIESPSRLFNPATYGSLADDVFGAIGGTVKNVFTDSKFVQEATVGALGITKALELGTGTYASRVQRLFANTLVTAPKSLSYSGITKLANISKFSGIATKLLGRGSLASLALDPLFNLGEAERQVYAERDQQKAAQALKPQFSTQEQNRENMKNWFSVMEGITEDVKEYNRISVKLSNIPKQKVVDDWFSFMRQLTEDLRSASLQSIISNAKAKIMKPSEMPELGGAVPLSDLQRVGGAKIFSGVGGPNPMVEEQKKTNKTLQDIYKQQLKQDSSDKLRGMIASFA